MTKAQSTRQRTVRQTPRRLGLKNPQHGLGLSVFHGARVQRGYGLGNILSGLFRKALPYLWKGAKYAGKAALKTGVDVANDVKDGHDMKSSLKTRTKQLGRELGSKAVEGVVRQLNTQTGRGRKRPIKKLTVKQFDSLCKGSKQSTRSSQQSIKPKKQATKKKTNQDIFGYF